MEDTGDSGVTLVELLVTLALVALLVAVAAPAMAAFIDKARLRSAAQTLAQELRQARNHALDYQRTIHFSLVKGVDQWCYGWRDDSTCSCDSPAPAALCRSSTDMRVHQQRSADFPAVQLSLRTGAARALVLFSPVRGSATAATFVLRNRHDEAHVIVSPLGRVRLCSPAGGIYPLC